MQEFVYEEFYEVLKNAILKFKESNLDPLDYLN